MIPEHKEAIAVEMYRSVSGDPNDLAMAAIHRALWPEGNASVSVSMLRTLLRSLAAAADSDPASDDLPEDLEDAVKDLKRMRSALMDALGEVEKDDYAPGLEGGPPPRDSRVAVLAGALTRVVSTQIAASKHQSELWQHREQRRAAERASRASRGARR